MNINEVWTEPRVERLKFLWAAGWSCSQIADDIQGGITRNSVISKVHRLKLPHPAGKSVQPRGTERRSKNNPLAGPRAEPKPAIPAPPAARLRNGYDPSLKRNPSHNILASIAIAGTEPGLPKKLEEPAVGEGLQLVDLQNHTCRWPFGHPNTSNFYFCGEAGADMKEKRPYCAFHQRKSVDRTSMRSPKAFEKSALYAAS